MKWRALICCLAFGATASGAFWVDTPLEQLAANSDCVVIGRVTGIAANTNTFRLQVTMNELMPLKGSQELGDSVSFDAPFTLMHCVQFQMKPADAHQSSHSTSFPVPLPADYHMHTPLCRHATGEPTEYAARAVAVGLSEIGFTDHSPMKRDDFDNWRMRADQLDDYVEKVRRAQREHSQLIIRLGLEVDFLPGHEDWIRELAARHPWDYFIGSVHYVSDNWDVDNPEKLARWKDRDAFEVWSIYFERLTMAAESNLFEIIGHVDLPKKFGFIPQRDCTPMFEKFLDAAKKADVAIELNTAGLRKDCKEIYPSPKILQLAHERGVPITFGSDAHAPGEVGMDLAKATKLASGIGYTQRCRFIQRRRDFVTF